jgi:SAM-dependent methyltransferase
VRVRVSDQAYMVLYMVCSSQSLSSVVLSHCVTAPGRRACVPRKAPAMAAPLVNPIFCPILIGRGPYLSALQGCVDEASGGRGQVILVDGEAGIGKSRLISEVGIYAATRGFQIITGHCFEQDEALPYAPLITHRPSIEYARASAREANVSDRVIFDVSSAERYPGTGYDLITFFDSLHDMGDPVGAIRHARETLAPDGSLMIVEPMAGQRVEENLNPIGRAFSAFSVLCCMPNSPVRDSGLQGLARALAAPDIFPALYICMWTCCDGPTARIGRKWSYASSCWTMA